MKRNVTVSTDATQEQLFGVVSDLSTYPEWLDIVAGVETADPHDGDEGPAWNVTLRAQLGRFARSKKLRIVRIGASPNDSATFARRETDGRDHASWDMRAAVTPTDSGSELMFDLAYSGGLWSNVLDAILGDEIDQALLRLPAYAADA